MLVLMCQAAGNRFAVDARQVVEVVARVRLQSVANAPAWLAGVCVYRGKVTCVMDLSYLVAGSASSPLWANRILMLPIAEEASSPLCGLIVEKIAVAQLDSTPPPHAPALPGMAMWGPLLLDADGMFQFLQLPRLFTAERRQALQLR